MGSNQESNHENAKATPSSLGGKKSNKKEKVVNMTLRSSSTTSKKPKRVKKKASARANNKKTEALDERVRHLENPTKAELSAFRKVTKQKRKSKPTSKKKKKAKPFLAKAPRKGKKYTMDLRIHSPATKGYFTTGGVQSSEAIVRLAKVKSLDIVAVTDFFSAETVDSVKDIAEETKITVIPGIDLRCRVGTCEEIFFTALFPETTGTSDLETVLEELSVPKSAYGDQSFVLDIKPSSLIEVVERHHGFLIPSHVDKTPYRRLALRTLIEDFGFHSFDLVADENMDFFEKEWPEGEFTFLSFSNANALGQIGSRTSEIKLEKPGFEGLKKQLQRRT